MPGGLSLINAKKLYTDRYEADERIIGLLIVNNDNQSHPLLDGFDTLVLVITTDGYMSQSISHYIKDDVRIQERWLYAHHLEQWLFQEECRYVIQWLLEGEIVFDRTGYVTKLREELRSFRQDLREERLLQEFALFLKTYLQSKEYLKREYYLDAYSQIVEAIHHWARIVVIEAGVHPEEIVWEQVYEINPGVYKLYDELTRSDETLEQRLQLIVLVCEFTIVSKMKDCCKLLLDILKSGKRSWSVLELSRHPRLQHLNIDLTPVLKKLAAKSLVKEILAVRDPQFAEIELQYSAV